MIKEPIATIPSKIKTSKLFPNRFVYGEPPSGGVLILPNHPGRYDYRVIRTLLPWWRTVNVIIHGENMDWRGWLTGLLPVYNKTSTSGLNEEQRLKVNRDTFFKSAYSLWQGGNVIIFPEGQGTGMNGKFNPDITRTGGVSNIATIYYERYQTQLYAVSSIIDFSASESKAVNVGFGRPWEINPDSTLKQNIISNWKLVQDSMGIIVENQG